MPLYKITEKDAEKDANPRLVSAGTKAQALKHVVADRFDIEAVSSPVDAADLVAKGSVLEHAAAED